MVVSLVLCVGTLWNGTVSRMEGAVLVLGAGGLMLWLYRRSPVFQRIGRRGPRSGRGRPARGRAPGRLDS